MTKLRELVLYFPDFMDISNAHLFLLLLFCPSIFMRGIETSTNFRADRAAESGLLQIPKAENQRHNFQDILTLDNLQVNLL